MFLLDLIISYSGQNVKRVFDLGKFFMKNNGFFFFRKLSMVILPIFVKIHVFSLTIPGNGNILTVEIRFDGGVIIWYIP